MTEILDLEMQENDAGAKTIRDYLLALLSAVWEEDEGFSGKRPFGNSGWKFELYVPLIKADLVKGNLDPDGYVENIDKAEAHEIIKKAIASLK